MMIRGTTRVLGIFGDPVAHSLSPRMQNAALQASGIDAVYVPFRVGVDDLPQAIAALRVMGIWGVNLTIPHKETVLPWLDALDAEAAQIGAVNTLVNRAGQLCGYNTDARGFLTVVCEELRLQPAGRRVLLLGAGGACRAALVALAQAGVSWIGIANRSLARAVALQERYAPLFPTCEITALKLSAGDLNHVLPTVDLLVNTSSVGLHGEVFPLPLCSKLSASARVCDMVYTSEQPETPLVAEARVHGLLAVDGRPMLVAQGEEAFRLWTGNPPPKGVMRAALSVKHIEL